MDVSLFEEAYGGELATKIVRGFCRRPVTLRVNRIKSTAESLMEEFRRVGISFERVPWYEDAFVLLNATEEDIRETAAYREGRVYLQSLSSMLPPLVLNAKPNDDVLDMTAAPGGKTTEICALTGNAALVTACEKDSIRFERMKFNFARQGARVNAMKTDALALDEMFSFDKILLDAPCSGSGTIQNPNARLERSFVGKCAIRQEKLLKKGLKLLKRGGILVYSTCSVLPAENGEVVLKVCKETGAELVPLDFPSNFDARLLPSPEHTACILPDEKFEGFFLAKLQKF